MLRRFKTILQSAQSEIIEKIRWLLYDQLKMKKKHRLLLKKWENIDATHNVFAYQQRKKSDTKI